MSVSSVPKYQDVTHWKNEKTLDKMIGERKKSSFLHIRIWNVDQVYVIKFVAFPSPHISHIVDLDTDYTVRIGKSNLNRFYLCRNKRFLLFRQNRPFLKSQQQKSNLRFNIIHDVLKLANNDRRQTLPFQRSEVFVVSPGWGFLLFLETL